MYPSADAELRERLLALEATMPVPATGRRPRGTSRLLAAGVVLVVLALTFAGGVVAGEVVQRTQWRDSGLFTPGGPLYCTDLRNMTPREAAPLLDALGYRVVWQDEHVPGARVIQTRVPPDGGYLTDGIARGRDLIIIADSEPLPASRCP